MALTMLAQYQNGTVKQLSTCEVTMEALTYFSYPYENQDLIGDGN